MSSAAVKPIRVLLIDDSSIIRLGLRSVLEDRSDITIVGEAGNCTEGLAAVDKLKPDLVLLDLHLPDKPGFTVCREILKRHGTIKVLILTSATEERNVHDAVAAGAHGYLTKDSDGDALVQAITRVAAGHSVIDPSLTSHMLSLVKTPLGSRPSDKLALLSPQEQRVLAYLTEGLTNKEIGAKMNLTEKTVKNYLVTIFGKLNITRRTQAAVFYSQINKS
jgi:two-component system response regulator DevR